MYFINNNFVLICKDVNEYLNLYSDIIRMDIRIIYEYSMINDIKKNPNATRKT